MNSLINPEDRSAFPSKYDLPDLRQGSTDEQLVAGYTAAIGQGVLLPDLKSSGGTTTTEIELTDEQMNLLMQGYSPDLKAGFDPEMVDQLVEAMIKAAHIEESGEKLEQITEKLRAVAQYILAHTHKHQALEKDEYRRSDETQLPVPVTHTSEGQIAIPLKSKPSKLGRSLGSGAFKKVKSALVLTAQKGTITVESAVSATMSSITATDRKAIENEKKMLLRLKELGINENIVKCITVTDYHKKVREKETSEAKIGITVTDDKTEEEPLAAQVPKIGVIMEFCNGGDLKGAIEARYLNDQELELIAEGVLNGVNFLHENGIYHSDLKPANLLLIKNKAEEIIGVKIADFGCTRDLNDESQRTYFSGDRDYHSPELKQLNQKMNERINPDLKDELSKYAEAKKAYDIVFEKKKDLKQLVREKQKAVDRLPKFSSEEEIQNAQTALDEAKAAKDEFKAKFEEATAAFKKVADEYTDKKESLIDPLRKELWSIDETILKSDIFAVGKIFEELFKKYEGRLTPEMKQLIADMQKTNLGERLSAKQAMDKFQTLKSEGKVLLPKPSLDVAELTDEELTVEESTDEELTDEEVVTQEAKPRPANYFRQDLKELADKVKLPY